MKISFARITFFSTIGGITTLLLVLLLTPLVFDVLDLAILLGGSVVSASAVRALARSLTKRESGSYRFVEYLFFISWHWILFSLICFLTSNQIIEQTTFVVARVVVASLLLVSIFWYIQSRWREEQEKYTFLEKEKDASG